MGNLATTKWVDDTCKVGKNENEQRSTSRNKEWIPWFFFNWGYGSYGINMKKLLGIPSLSYLSWVLWQKPFGASHDLQNNHNMTLVVSPTAQKSYETYKTIVWNKVHCFASVITQIIDILNMEYWMCIYIYTHLCSIYLCDSMYPMCLQYRLPIFCETWAIHRKPKHLANGQPLFTNKDVATLDIAM